MELSIVGIDQRGNLILRNSQFGLTRVCGVLEYGFAPTYDFRWEFVIP